MSFIAVPVLALGVLGSAACGQEPSAPDEPRLAPGPLSVKAVTWNSRQVAVGQVRAVADRGDDVVVLSDQGAFFFTSGLLTGQDLLRRDLQRAAVLPAATAGSDDWVVAVDDKGRLRWLRGPGISEDAGARYGLTDGVRDLANLGRGRAAFASAQALWVAGQGRGLALFSQNPSADASLGGGAGLAVMVAADAGLIHVYDAGDDPAGAAGRRYALPGVIGAAIDESVGGKLVAVTARALYREADDGTLRRVHQQAEGAGAIRGILASPAGAWIQIEDGLAQVQGDRLLRTPAGLVPAGARLMASPSGDVWVLADGVLRRLSVEGAGADQELWRHLVLPIYTRACSQCHLRGGAQSDLSTYTSWASQRALIEQRAVQGQPTPMPPPGSTPLTPSELNDLKRWLNAAPMP